MEEAQSKIRRFVTSDHGLLLESIAALALGYHIWGKDLMVMGALAFVIATVAKIRILLGKAD